MRFAFALCLAGALLAPIISSGADRKESGGPWIVPAAIIRSGQQVGSGVYLNSGLIITAAHLTAVDAKMGVRIAGMVSPELPAKILKHCCWSRKSCSRALGYPGCSYVSATMARGSGHCCGRQACHGVSNRLTTGAAFYVANKVFYSNS